MNCACPRDDGISPAIAAILILALTVVLAGVAAVVFMGFSADVPSAAPVFGLSIDVSGGNTVSVRHMNGEAIPRENLDILVNGVSKISDFKPDTSECTSFRPGITLTCGHTEKVETVAVVYKNGASSTLLVEKKFK